MRRTVAGHFVSGTSFTVVSQIAAFALLLSPCLAEEPTPVETAEALKAAGGVHFDRGEYAAAAEKWRAAVEAQPDSVDLRNRLGMALTKLKQYDEAAAELKAAAALDPDEPRSLFNLALLYIHAGDLQLAERTLRSTLRAGSWYPETHYHLGLIAESSGDVKTAIDEYIKELNVNAGCAKAWLRLKALRREVEGSVGAPKSDFGLMLGAIGFGIGLACLFLSQRRSRAVVAMALAMLAAGSAQAEVDYGVYQSGVRQEALKATIEKLSLSHPSRVVGYEGCNAAADHIQGEFKRIGLSDIAADTFSVPMPIDKGTWLTIVATGERHRIHPFWPNLVRPPILPDGGVTGNLIDAGSGVLSEVDGKDVEGSIALLDMDSEDRYVDLRVLGVQAVLFPEPDDMTRGQAEFKFLNSPVNIPRFWAPKAVAAELRQLAKSGTAQIKVECKVEWQPVEGKNIYGYLWGTESKGGKSESSLTKPTVNWHWVIWPILLLWAGAWALKRYDKLGEQRDAALPVLMVATALVVFLLNCTMLSVARKRYEKEKRSEEDLIVLEAYYDSMSVVPGLSPGAEQATSVAALLELAELFKQHQPKRSVLFLAASGHCQALAGISEFMLSHCRSEKFRGRVSNPTFRRRFKEQIDFNLLVGLDLSSHTDRLGVFHEGHYTTLGQRSALANRRFFAPYGQKFTECAKRIAGQRALKKLEDDLKAKGQTLTPKVQLAAETIIAEFAAFSTQDVIRWRKSEEGELDEEAVQTAIDAMIAADLMKPATKYVMNADRFPAADYALLFEKKKLGLGARLMTAVGLQRAVPEDLVLLPKELKSVVEVIARQKKPFVPSELETLHQKLVDTVTDRLMAYRPTSGESKGRIGLGGDPATCTVKEVKAADKKVYAKVGPMLVKYGYREGKTDEVTLGQIAATVEEMQLMPKAIELLEKDGALVKSYAYKAESFLENGITPVGGVIWQSFIPGLLALDSEVLVKMALPGMSLVSVNDNRRYVDTPLDRPEHVDLPNLTGQVRRIACLLAHALNDEQFHPSTKVKLRDYAKAMRTRVVEFVIGESLLPDSPVPGVLAVLRDPNTQVAGQWEKTFMGVRGATVAMTDKDGYFEHPFVFTRSVTVESYKLDPSTGEICMAADRGPEGDGTYPLIVPLDWQLKEAQTVVFPCRSLDIYDLFDPRYLRSLDTINVLGPLDFAPLRYGYSELAGRGASVFFEEGERVKIVMGSGVFGIQYLLTNVQKTPAKGFVTMWSDGPAPEDIVIPKDTEIVGDNGLPYRTTEEAVLAKGRKKARAPVAAVVPGAEGNVEGKELTRFVAKAPAGIANVANDRAIDTGSDNPTGIGFPANAQAALFRTSQLAAENMFVLNESRIRDLRKYGIKNDRLQRLHDQADVALAMAKKALSKKSYSEYSKHIRAARGFEAKAYPDVRGTANDTVKGIIFYFGLLLPFAFFLERLIFGFPDIRKQIGASAGLFVLVFVVLRFVHPAFKLSNSPYIIFLAFVLLAMALFVITIVVTKFNEQIAEMRRKAAKVHEADVGRLSASAAAFNLGISNMKKRKLRTTLTTVTLILLTFTVLSFTSVNTYTRFNQIPIRPKPEWYGVTDWSLEKLSEDRVPAEVMGKLKELKGQRHETDDELRKAVEGVLTADELSEHWYRIKDRARKPLYRGMLVRDRNWNFMEDIAYEYVFSGFIHEPEKVAFAPRAWYMSNTREGQLHIRVEAPDGKDTFAVAAVGMTPEERHTTGIDGPDYLLAGKWLEKDDDKRVCILPGVMADRIGIQPEDVGKKHVTIFGEQFLVKGILKSDTFSDLVDLDNEQVSPVDLSAEDPQFDPNETVATLRSNATDIRSFTHLDPNGCVYVPYDVVIEHGGTLRSISVRLDDSVEFDAFLALVKKFMSRVGMTIWVSEGDRVQAYSSMGLSSFSGLGNLFIPIAIAGLIVLNTMMGSVYERFREIGIYSSVGLAPVHIGALFLAESCVYAVVGAISGYLVGQVVGTTIAGLGLLPGITLNYSSMSAVASTFIVMAVVILSTLYPAKVASSMAVPDVTRKWKFPDPEGDDWTFDFPFTVASKHVLGLYVFLNNYFDGYKEESVGSFYTNEVEFLTLDSEYGQGYLIRMNVWLAPFDMGISQNVELRALPTEDEGIARIQVFIHRMSGEMSSWQRLNKGFLTEIRKQFLIWRTVPESVKIEYAEEGRRLVEELTAAAV